MTSHPLTIRLLDWYDKHGRNLPWRVKGGAHSNPYAVWVAEIMLQQTTVATVYDYFLRWMAHFPTLQSLADAPIDDVLRLWQGLGYYTRAKKMHECATVLVKEYDGRFPADRKELLKLAGIGPYTASSISAFAFNQPETVVDGNVMRVIARLYGITGELDKNDIYARAQQLTSYTRAADYASAIMDLGATVCKPAHPLCDVCPWQSDCVAYQLKLCDQIPQKKRPKKTKKTGTVFIVKDSSGRLFLQKRAGKGLLSGLWELPWTDDINLPPPFAADWQPTTVRVLHIFTHIDLTLLGVSATVPNGGNAYTKQGVFVSTKDLPKYALSKLMQKVIGAVLKK